MQLQVDDYARWSKEDKNASVKSLGDQIDVIKQLAMPSGCVPGETYQENKTASKPNNRPEYARMVERIRSGQVFAVRVWHINRLARNMQEAGELAQLLNDGKLREIITPYSIYRTGDNILPLLLEQGMAAQYSNDLRVVVLRGMNSSREAGRWTHRTPVGYRNIRDPHNPKIGLVVRDEERFHLMRKGWEMLLTKAYSVPQVVDTLNNVYGFQTRKTAVRGGGRLSYSHAYKLFSSPFYAGYTLIEGQMRRGVHEAMVTEDEFNAVQQHIRSSRRQRKIKHDFTYKHLVRCAYCGLAVTSERRIMSNEQEYISYRCSDTYRTCTKKGISEPALEAEISRLLECITMPPELCDAALQNLLRWLEGQGHDAEVTLAEQHQAMQDVERQLNNLLDMWLRGILTDQATYRDKEAALQQQRNELLMGIEKTQKEFERMRQQAKNGFAFAKYARTNFLVAGSDRKREIARALGITYLLKGREKQLIVELDPLLVEIVRFTGEIRKVTERQFELDTVGETGSGSSLKNDGVLEKKGGRAMGRLFEPFRQIEAVLKISRLPNLGLS